MPKSPAAPANPDSFQSLSHFALGKRRFAYFSLKAAEENGLKGVSRLPFCLRILLENLLRHEDGETARKEDMEALAAWLDERRSSHEIAFRPARVLMQDLTGVPALADLAAMRDALQKMGGSPERVNPLVPVDLVVDHSVMVDRFGSLQAMAYNREREYARNQERYAFLKWGAQTFRNFRVVPPGTGICHQVNLEHLAEVARLSPLEDGGALVFPDTLVGMDSHTTMINALGVLGWGVGGIEAEAAMLGQPVSMTLPDVVGMRLTGRLREGVTATDLVLRITEMLRAHGVVGRFVEFAGPGLRHLALEDRATIANMAPEYGATCSFFAVDGETIAYLKRTARHEDQCALVETYARAQGLFRDEDAPEPLFSSSLSLDLGEVSGALAGPRRPQDRVALEDAAESFSSFMESQAQTKRSPKERVPVAGANHDLGDGDIVIAAITSCTNTSNPRVMLGAGLLAREARARGLAVKPWVKTSLAPGSQVVADYLEKADLQKDLDALGFHLVGYGCTTCIGNSGPLPPALSDAIAKEGITAAAILSGNRNFEGRIHADVRANYLASPMLVVAYALAGSIRRDLTREPLGADKAGKPVFLKEIWPSDAAISEAMARAISPPLFAKRYAKVFDGDAAWRGVRASKKTVYDWDSASTYVRPPPFFETVSASQAPPPPVKEAHILALLEDSITTDHISPAGAISGDSPAAAYLKGEGVAIGDFNSYGARRGNHEVMIRGTFANGRLRNQMAPGSEGGETRLYPDDRALSIYEAARVYAERGVPLVIFAGREYGTGSSRDWAAKGTRLLGVRAVIAQSFERIHRSNLIGMGVLPLQFAEGESWRGLNLTGAETVSLDWGGALRTKQTIAATILSPDGAKREIALICRVDTGRELAYMAHDGILPYVLRRLAA